MKPGLVLLVTLVLLLKPVLTLVLLSKVALLLLLLLKPVLVLLLKLAKGHHLKLALVLMLLLHLLRVGPGVLVGSAVLVGW